MSLTPINFIKSDSATATNGSDTITVTGNVDCSWIYKASMVFLGTRQMVQAISGTKPDGSGNSTIKLKEAWADPNTTAKLVVANSIEELASAKKVMVEFFGMLGDAMASGSGTLYFDGTGFTLKNFDPAALGTAATKDVTTSSTDNTNNRLVSVHGGDGWFGWGGSNAPNATNDDCNDTLITGVYRVDDSTTANIPDDLDNLATLVVHAWSGSFVTQTITERRDGQYEVRQWVRNLGAGSIWSDWLEIFHTGNLNVNEFGGLANDVIGFGVAVSSTSMRFYLPISSFSNPQSITVDGTFKIEKADGLDLITDISGGDISMTGSSSRVLRLSVDNITGLTPQNWYQIATETSSSKITVNF